VDEAIQIKKPSGRYVSSCKKYSKQDQRSLATCAVDWAERVLPYFEEVYPKDNRPRKAIEACRLYARTGVLKMAEIRGASLATHAAAREAKEDNAACFAARAAGQAVATAHVPQHAFGAAYYALKAVAAADLSNAEVEVAKERNWQSRRLPRNLRQEFLKRVVVQNDDHRISVRIKKGKGF
jgi:hypothetical protein